MNTTNAAPKRFSSTDRPRIGDKVMIGTHWRTSKPLGPYMVEDVKDDAGVYLILSGRGRWHLHESVEESGCTLVEAAPAAPQEPAKPMTKAVLDLLKVKGSLTSIEAQGVLRCRALPKRISELKDLGWKIITELKNDTTGQRYARYHLEIKAA